MRNMAPSNSSTGSTSDRMERVSPDDELRSEDGNALDAIGGILADLRKSDEISENPFLQYLVELAFVEWKSTRREARVLGDEMQRALKSLERTVQIAESEVEEAKISRAEISRRAARIDEMQKRSREMINDLIDG